MRRWAEILFNTVVVLLVVTALLIGALRVLLPYSNHYRPQLLQFISSVTDVPVDIKQITAYWRSYGPEVELQGIHVAHPDATLAAEKVTLALDVWQSLLHLRWQFRDLTFYHLDLDIHTPVFEKRQDGKTFKTNAVTDVMLTQIDHFDLKQSHVTFLSPSQAEISLDIPQLAWVNAKQRHRAKGDVTISSPDGQHGLFQVKLDLTDKEGLLNGGQIYLQADKVDMKPWLSRWLRDNTGLEQATFSLASWLTLDDGNIKQADVLLKQGQAFWKNGEQQHYLDVDNMLLHLTRHQQNWQLSVPELNLKTDGIAWPKGMFRILWLPEQQGIAVTAQPEEIRIRAAAISPERITPLVPMLAFLSTEFTDAWQQLSPKGIFDELSLDLPLKNMGQSRFRAKWVTLSWLPWKHLPGMNAFSGEGGGSLSAGNVRLDVKDSTIVYPEMFEANLDVHQLTGAISWQRDTKDALHLWSKDLDIQARSLWINGEFDFLQTSESEPHLGILAGIRLEDAREAWRYFPIRFMTEPLREYLEQALQGGSVDNATLIFAGTPKHFPFHRNDGLFQVSAPLRHATYAFQPEWPAIQDLDIDLDFINDGLWMSATHGRLDEVSILGVQAVIPEYLKHQLWVDADVKGEGQAIQQWFMKTPLKSSIGETLEKVSVGGNVNGHLHLDIPLEHGKKVKSTGKVILNNNRLTVVPINSTLQKVSGEFRFDDGELTSSPMKAHWFGQPVALNFSTQSRKKEFVVKVGINGQWAVSRLPWLPPEIARHVSGTGRWKSDIAVTLPHQSAMHYRVKVQGDLNNVSSDLPVPLKKNAKEVLPFTLDAKGNQQGFTLSGNVHQQNYFNSQWAFASSGLRMQRAALVSDDKKGIPALPKNSHFYAELPALDGEDWLVLLAAGMTLDTRGKSAQRWQLPEFMTFTSPALTLGGQVWRDLNVTIEPQSRQKKMKVSGTEIDGLLTMTPGAPWELMLSYLYYNPVWSSVEKELPSGESQNRPFTLNTTSFVNWPSLMLRCKDCWFFGQRLRTVSADILSEPDSLTLNNGLIDTGNTQLILKGRWQRHGSADISAVYGQFTSKEIDNSTDYFGISTPLKGAPAKLMFDLEWQGTPWEPRIASLNGILNSELGKGEIAHMGGGRAGQLLRLVSFDALLRKLQLDFSDTFGDGFYFDRMRATAKIQNGVVHTEDLMIDGLSADIAMRGNVDLVTRKLNMEAVIAPEISATVGVATAFVVNPLIGAAVFAATKVLAPLWKKISFIRYQIHGSLDKPEVNEVLRQAREVQTE